MANSMVVSIIMFNICVCVCVCMCAWVCACMCGGFPTHLYPTQLPTHPQTQWVSNHSNVTNLELIETI